MSKQLLKNFMLHVKTLLKWCVSLNVKNISKNVNANVNVKF